jgi:hypothetical protein
VWDQISKCISQDERVGVHAPARTPVPVCRCASCIFWVSCPFLTGVASVDSSCSGVKAHNFRSLCGIQSTSNDALLQCCIYMKWEWFEVRLVTFQRFVKCVECQPASRLSLVKGERKIRCKGLAAMQRNRKQVTNTLLW